MKKIILLILSFSFVHAAGVTGLPSFTKQECTLGYDFTVDGDPNNEALSLYHRDNLSRLVTQKLIDKKFYVVILQKALAQRRFFINIQPSQSQGTISCLVSKVTDSKVVTKGNSVKIDQYLPVSNQMFNLCYNLIMDAELNSLGECK